MGEEASPLVHSAAMRSFVAGGIAGSTVDAVLYPIDTIKSQLQARADVRKVAVGRHFYAGLVAAMAGSFPAAAAFWTGYHHGSQLVHQSTQLSEGTRQALAPVVAAVAGDLVACSVRVPFEVVKQQMQVGLHTDTRTAVLSIMRAQGPRGFFAGLGSTVVREIPFDVIEFSLWEAAKRQWFAHYQESALPYQSALMGAVSGGIAAAVTTPLDVVKTRLMTQGTKQHYSGVLDCLSSVYRKEGAKALFAGLVPRTMWISLGGFVFFGAYEKAQSVLQGRPLFA
ncbi:MAG: hypothetical protein MHM6MM_002382 [Cercozoa sp. M6MM]